MWPLHGGGGGGAPALVEPGSGVWGILKQSPSETLF
jgi:hypothetical protein